MDELEGAVPFALALLGWCGWKMSLMLRPGSGVMSLMHTQCTLCTASTTTASLHSHTAPAPCPHCQVYHKEIPSHCAMRGFMALCLLKLSSNDKIKIIEL